MPQTSLADEIASLVAARCELRAATKFAEADVIRKQLVEPPYLVELFDQDSEPFTTYQHSIPPDIYKQISAVWRNNKSATPADIIATTGLSPAVVAIVFASFNTTNTPAPICWRRLPPITIPVSPCPATIPLVIATVDSPQYQSRLPATLSSLPLHAAPVNMLDLSLHPQLGSKRIVYEGWRQVLLPRIQQLLVDLAALPPAALPPFVLICEDDVRLAATYEFIVSACASAFAANPDLDVLSLGHTYSKITKGVPLFDHLETNGGVHALTLVAVNVAKGLDNLVRSLEEFRKRATHLDLFLFHGKHSLKVALSDPPLAGWCEVTETLNKAGNGSRRRGGGRLASVVKEVTVVEPSDVDWIAR